MEKSGKADFVVNQPNNLKTKINMNSHVQNKHRNKRRKNLQTGI